MRRLCPNLSYRERFEIFDRQWYELSDQQRQLYTDIVKNVKKKYGTGKKKSSTDSGPSQLNSTENVDELPVGPIQLSLHITITSLPILQQQPYTNDEQSNDEGLLVTYDSPIDSETLHSSSDTDS